MKSFDEHGYVEFPEVLNRDAWPVPPTLPFTDIDDLKEALEMLAAYQRWLGQESVKVSNITSLYMGAARKKIMVVAEQFGWELK